MKIILQTMDHGAQYRFAQEYLSSKMKNNDYKIIVLSQVRADPVLKKINKYWKKKKILILIKNLIGRIIHRNLIKEFNKKTFQINSIINKNLIGKKLSSEKVSCQKDAKEIIENFNPDRVIIIGSPYLTKDYFIEGIMYFNLHIGIIPFYRGLKCIEWAIINSDYNNIGYTIHEMTPRLDLGDVYKKEYINHENLTLSQIYAKAYIDGITSIIDLCSKPILMPLNKIHDTGKLFYTIDFTGFEIKKLIQKIKI